MSTPQPPSADQLAAARLAHWRQTSAEAAEPSTTALLTVESARRFVSSCGLLLFTPRPQHIASPAPSFVEACLGVSDSSPALAQTSEARTLLARLIAEGNAVPLNLLGAPSTTPDTPDFIASAAAFPYVFTLRGDKAWKQPPTTSGPTKVSPLALNTYTLLVEHGPTSAYDLMTQLGKEVTEAAVLRSLNELWQHLRVLPVPRQDGAATLWEPVANRFTKQLKAGANAGQPSALSALISLYLSQALLATEDEIETFLSPLAPRSRVRDVLHALTGARQLETVAVDGKTHLHIHGELPAFADAAAAQASPVQTSPDKAADTSAPAPELAADGTRIKKFIPKPRKVGTGYVERAKPFRGTAGVPRDRGSRSFERPGAARPSRPAGKFPGGKFTDRAAGRPSRPAFNKPWEEEKQERAARSDSADAGSSEQFQDIDLDAAAAPRPASPSRSGRPPFAQKARFGGDRPAYSRDRESPSAARPPRRDFRTPGTGDTRPPRRDFSAGPGATSSDRRPFGKPGFGDREPRAPREGSRPGFGDRPSFGDKQRRPFRRDDAPSDARPPRREFTPRTDAPPRPPRRDFPSRGENASRAPYRGRPEGEAADSDRPARPAFRKFDAPRGPRKPFAAREGGDARPPRRDLPDGKPSFGPRDPSDRSAPRKREGGFAGKREGSFAAKREGSFGDKREGSFAGKREGSFPKKREDRREGSKPSGGGYAGKKPFAARSSSGSSDGPGGKKPFSGKPGGRRSPDAPGASTFDKFKGNNKPWGNRPPGRKPKPDPGEA